MLDSIYVSYRPPKGTQLIELLSNRIKIPLFGQSYSLVINKAPPSKSHQTYNCLVVEQVGGVSLINRATPSSKIKPLHLNFLFRSRMLKVPKKDPVFR